MKHFLSGLFFLALTTLATAANYTINSQHAHARFSLLYLGQKSHVGGFYGLNGVLAFDETRQTGTIDLIIPVNTLKTSSNQFTEYLKSEDLFNAQAFPKMRFVSTQFNFQNGNLVSVNGNLTALGKTHPVKLVAQKFGCRTGQPHKNRVCRGRFTATLDRTQWGMNYLIGKGVGRDVDLTVVIEAATNH
ncbi:YceI family protein [Neisseria sp. 83E34]|uniref:YceI family protein n=1 Tax=Neisseria sp. 83E34 TaxID=1692264 RepID=UPI0006CE6453|nr:YceI family protein [Neisseria sp. 83E34]KPN71742.1 hypothetical protein AKG09_05505 [Neisseria sp. 83E34]